VDFEVLQEVVMPVEAFIAVRMQAGKCWIFEDILDRSNETPTVGYYSRFSCV
jgi:hypothetical protein